MPALDSLLPVATAPINDSNEASPDVPHAGFRDRRPEDTSLDKAKGFLMPINDLAMLKAEHGVAI
jgi:hypothetical protein